MRVAAGVILIIAAVINIFAAIGYFGAGAAGSLAGAAIEKAAEEEAKKGGEGTAEMKAAMADLKKGTAQMQSGSGGLMFFGIFLIVSVGLSITTAVFLFKASKPTFVMAGAGIAILAEVIGIFITAFGITNLIGIAGGALAIVAARSFAKSSSPSAAA